MVETMLSAPRFERAMPGQAITQAIWSTSQAEYNVANLLYSVSPHAYYSVLSAIPISWWILPGRGRRGGDSWSHRDLSDYLSHDTY
jgi:hypothetical protein